ncbi:MAG TPA: c-type cytochrome, partial [Candidatus Obscuribacterales bacterium]
FEEKQKKLARAPFNAEPMSVENYRSRIAQIEALLKSPQYKQSLAEKEKLTKKLDELNIEHRFIKADLDAAYYKRDSAIEKSAEESGKKDSGDELAEEKEVQNIQKKLKENEAQAAQISAALLAVTKKVELAEATLSSLKNGLNKETSTLASIKERIAKTESRPPSIQQIVVSGLGEYERVDRCITCHQGIDRPDFANAEKLVYRAHSNREELFKAHPIEKVGCTSCHDGQGRALNVSEAHEGDKHFHTPLLKGAFVQASCVRCHENAPLISSAYAAQEGAALFQTRGCIACHKVEGSPYLSITPGKLGPDLSTIKDKLRPDWLVTWIEDPKKIHAETFMPEFGEKGKGLPRSEAVALAAYLTYSSGDATFSPAAEKYAGAHSASAETVGRGKKLFQDRGCLGCHDLGKDRDVLIGPRHVELDGAADKLSRQWIFSWIEDPSAMSKTTVMPKFPLSQEEIACLSDYLLSLRTPDPKPAMEKVTAAEIASGENIDHGKMLVKKYGCYSCHNVPGFEKNMEKIGPELSDFASKDETLLFWGTKNAVAHDKRNWYSWTRARLDEPKSFETDRIEAVMPNMHLSNDETEKILVFLKTLSSERTVAKQHRRLLKPGDKELIAGGQLINHYGCTGCHSMYDAHDTTLVAGFKPEPKVKYGTIAPNLTPEGERVRSDWLADFLRAPYVMRPYLSARMPAFAFKGSDHRAMVDYFKATQQRATYQGWKETPDISPSINPARGQKLIAQRQCVTCHQINGKELKAGSGLKWYHDMKAARRMAPDLASVPRKLNPDWADRWIENPHAIMPDTTMPNVALTREEASAIRSYLASGALNNKSSNGAK